MKSDFKKHYLLNDKDLNSDYLIEKLWSMINEGGKTDDVERNYFATVEHELRSDKKQK